MPSNGSPTGRPSNTKRVLTDVFGTRSQVSSARTTARAVAMLRKLTWSALYAVLGAAAAVGARAIASKIWRVTTGEEPPAKK